MKLASIIFTSFAASVAFASSSAAKEDDVVRLRRASQAQSKATAQGEPFFWYVLVFTSIDLDLTSLSYFTLDRTSKRSANVPWIR